MAGFAAPPNENVADGAVAENPVEAVVVVDTDPKLGAVDPKAAGLSVVDPKLGGLEAPPPNVNRDDPAADAADAVVVAS